MKNTIDKFNFFLEKAILEDLDRNFSFGCVNRYSNGSHKDMTYQTFIDSSESIRESLQKIKREEIKDFKDLRNQGFVVEKNMFHKTSGVNTHKGLVFLTMFLAKFYVENGYIEGLEQEIINFSKLLRNDYNKNQKAKVWARLKINDIRYFPLTGFRDLISLSKRDYKNDLENTLLSLELISRVDDTTTINRSNIETLYYVQKRAGEILCIDREDREEILEKTHLLNQFYLDNNLSSGGVADLFTIVKLLSYIREE